MLSFSIVGESPCHHSKSAEDWGWDFFLDLFYYLICPFSHFSGQIQLIISFSVITRLYLGTRQLKRYFGSIESPKFGTLSYKITTLSKGINFIYISIQLLLLKITERTFSIRTYYFTLNTYVNTIYFHKQRHFSTQIIFWQLSTRRKIGIWIEKLNYFNVGLVFHEKFPHISIFSLQKNNINLSSEYFICIKH